MPAFVEVRLENNLVLYGSVGGPQYSTDVIVVRSGREQRNVNWSQSRGRWEIGERQVDTAELQAIIGFFRARQGRAEGFRFKDWADYRATRTPLIHNGVITQGILGNGLGNGTAGPYQTNKLYSSGATSTTRKISKLVAPISVYVNGVLTGAGVPDMNTGLVTFLAGAPSITDTLTWTGEFDLPARFDVDEMRTRFDAYRAVDGEALHWIFTLPVVELRQ
ncbi:MAG: phage distal tail protein, Rcc01695 family [Gammaproteobacteria bacterium]